MDLHKFLKFHFVCKRSTRTIVQRGTYESYRRTLRSYAKNLHKAKYNAERTAVCSPDSALNFVERHLFTSCTKHPAFGPISIKMTCSYYSTVTTASRYDIKDWTSGSCQDIALGGCSKWLWPPASNVRPAHKTQRVNIKRLSWTESRSSAEMPGFPSRNSGVRNAGGPLGFNFKREYSLHAGELAL